MTPFLTQRDSSHSMGLTGWGAVWISSWIHSNTQNMKSTKQSVLPPREAWWNMLSRSHMPFSDARAFPNPLTTQPGEVSAAQPMSNPRFLELKLTAVREFWVAKNRKPVHHLDPDPVRLEHQASPVTLELSFQSTMLREWKDSGGSHLEWSVNDVLNRCFCFTH